MTRVPFRRQNHIKRSFGFLFFFFLVLSCSILKLGNALITVLQVDKDDMFKCVIYLLCGVASALSTKLFNKTNIPSVSFTYQVKTRKCLGLLYLLLKTWTGSNKILYFVTKLDLCIYLFSENIVFIVISCSLHLCLNMGLKDYSMAIMIQ